MESTMRDYCTYRNDEFTSEPTTPFKITETPSSAPSRAKVDEKTVVVRLGGGAEQQQFYVAYATATA